MRTGLLDYSPADRGERPKKEKFAGSIYNEKELEQLFQVTKGDPIELGVILAAFYGLRRSEAVGLRWEAIDFAQKTITICHTVAQVTIGGKSTVIPKDRTKTKSSYCTLPLGKPFEDLLHRLESQQAENRTLCRNACCKKYADDIYANELGERIKPNYITQHFPMSLLKLPQNRRKTPLKSSGGGTQKNPQSLESKEIAGMHQGEKNTFVSNRFRRERVCAGKPSGFSCAI